MPMLWKSLTESVIRSCYESYAISEFLAPFFSRVKAICQTTSNELY